MLLTVHAILMRQAFRIQEYLCVHFVGTYAYNYVTSTNNLSIKKKLVIMDVDIWFCDLFLLCLGTNDCFFNDLSRESTLLYCTICIAVLHVRYWTLLEWWSVNWTTGNAQSSYILYIYLTIIIYNPPDTLSESPNTSSLLALIYTL